MKGSHHMSTTKLTLFAVNDEWDIKEDTIKNALYTQGYA